MKIDGVSVKQGQESTMSLGGHPTDVVNGVPTIFYEDLRAEPQKKNMKNINQSHANQLKHKDKPKFPNSANVNLAIKEMEGQLQRLKIHRSRLGY
jgi:hypothetical protein